MTTVTLKSNDFKKLDILCALMKKSKIDFLSEIIEGLWSAAYPEAINQCLENENMRLMCMIKFEVKPFEVIVGETTKTHEELMKEIGEKFEKSEKNGVTAEMTLEVKGNVKKPKT